MKISIKKLKTPNPVIIEALNKWANDPVLVPLTRPIRNKQVLEERFMLTEDMLTKRIENDFVYLIYVDNFCVGQMSFQIDSDLLHKKVTGTAWIGLGIGEASARGKGVGVIAMDYLEKQIYAEGLKRIELGVFSFNTPAIKLYKKLGYTEIGRKKAFTYWQNRMWDSICMEKYL